tara:strand:+ start:221742 stop:222059 length:318 start_codon:yes stop_codon:yes gene_type:complete
MIRCTFSDALKIKEDPVTRDIVVIYEHGFRININVQIVETDQNQMGWRINMLGNNEVIKAAKKELFANTVHYLEKRLRKALGRISFEDIILLTQAKAIKSVSRSD